MMTWTSRYNPPEAKNWQGRPDVPNRSCFFQIIELVDLQKNLEKSKQLTFGLIGFCCDEGIRRNFGRIGAFDGPLAIRNVLAKMPIQRENIRCLDVGDITCLDQDLESAQFALSDAIALMLKQHIIPIILGGGHELAFGHYQGIAKKFPQENLGIINFDAHFDMRPLLSDNKGSSGTPFLQIALAHENANRRFNYNCIGIQRTGNIPLLFQTAKKYHAEVIMADDLYQGDMTKCHELIDRVIKNNQIIYLSLCLDVFAQAYAPGVSAPQSLGLTPWQVIPLLRMLAESNKVVSYDIAELSPQYDKDQRTAKLAANFIYEIIHHHNKETGKT